jgi:RNA polymerase sigma factor (sigma-70 family)
MRAVQSATSGIELSDRELLHRFNDGDESAFTVLMNRHGGMVLGVCRRVLPTVQDAEDAFQATFLVLARKAPNGSWQPSIANWLYTTARRIAAKANRSASRRQRRESQRPATVSVSTLDQMTGREAFAVLDEELDRLPPIYREPLVLCYLEGLTRDEAAARLGIPPTTLKSQLDRGRKRLGEALTKRGVVLGAGLLALAIYSPAGASSPRLIDALRAASAGTISPSVAALSKGVAANGIIKKALLGVALAAATAAIGIGVAQTTVTTAGQHKEKSATQKKSVRPADNSERAKPIAVTGKVVDPDGKPVAGAKFVVIDDESGTPVPKIVTGEDGRFNFQIPHPYPEGPVRNPRPVVATAAGFGMDWLSEPREDAVFRLVPDLPIQGRVIDLEGKPVAGATVAVHNIHAGPKADFEKLLKNFKSTGEDRDEPAGKLNRAIWNRGGLGQEFQTKTAADGTFTLSGLGADRIVTLLVTGNGFADAFADVATRKGFDPKDTAEPKQRRDRERTRMLLYAPDFTLVVGPDKPVTGVVRDEKTGTPLAGVRVTGASYTGDIGFGTHWFHAWPTPWTTTDKDGRFTLRGLTKAKAYILVADPEEGTEHLHRFAYVEDSSGFEALKTGISLPRGVVVTGRVTDAVTGEGVASRVFYRPLEINELLGEFGGYDPPDYPAPWHRGRDTKTDLEGRYKITVMPGAGVVNIQTYGGSYERAKATQKEIDEGIVDKQSGFFRAVGQGGMYNPEFMHSYKIIRPSAKERTATLDVKLTPKAKEREN